MPLIQQTFVLPPSPDPTADPIGQSIAKLFEGEADTDRMYFSSHAALVVSRWVRNGTLTVEFDLDAGTCRVVEMPGEGGSET